MRFSKLPALLAILMVAAPFALAAEPATAPSSAVIIALHGDVDDYTRDSLFRKFAEARALGAKTVIVDLDTPGGLVTAGLDISRFLRRQEDIHTIAYVSDKAFSAGAMIAVACNEIVMAPSAVVGDCAPIIFDTSGQLQPMPAAERAKAQSPVVNDFDASADRNGYNKLLLESMVISERVVHWVQSPAGERRFVDQADYDKLTSQGWKPVEGVSDPVDGPDTLLTVQANEAVKLGLASAVVAAPDELAHQRGLNLLADLTPGAGERFIEILNNAAVRGILISVFFACLYIVLNAPGHGAAEATGILALGLLVGIPLLTGYAQWWEVIAIFSGLALLSFELLVFPGHGVSAVAGIVLMLFGLLMTFVGKEPAGPGLLPNMEQTWANLREGLLVITGGLGCALLLSMWLRRFLPHLPYFHRLILNEISGGNAAGLPMEDVLRENVWPGVGTEGKAVTELKPGGSAEFMDLSRGDVRKIAVISETGYVPAGAKLVVREARGNTILVRPVIV